LKISDYHISIGNATDVGKVREHNEDYLAHFDTPLGYCIIICDGMGGHAAGDVAAQSATAAIQQFLQDPSNKNSTIPIALKNAIEFANYKLKEMMNQNPALKGMGTTTIVALIKNGRLYTAHAGDSRLYLIKKGGIKQLTKDHSSVQQLIDQGVLTEAEAELSDKKNQISKAIGIFDKVEPTITESSFPLNKNDKLLLCSDGLTGHLSKEKIYETILSFDNIQSAAMKLVELANGNGGSDNITVQLVHYAGQSMRSKKKILSKRNTAIVIVVFALSLFWVWAFKNHNSNNKMVTKKSG